MPASPKRYWTVALLTTGTAPGSCYAGAEFAQVVTRALALADRIGSRLGSDDGACARHHFTVTARYEWMFGTPADEKSSAR